MKTLLSVITIVLISLSGIAQNTQNIRGTVTDADSRQTVIGARVELEGDSTGSFLASTDVMGEFRLNNVPVGRQTIIISAMGYGTKTLDVVLDAGKELVLNVSMEEMAVALDEAVIKGAKRGEVNNEMTTVSSRQFSVVETNRYAGSRGDPARMASNYAGVQGADDSRNDIVVRGNSPAGVLWRMEGINLPNPNHFAIAGTQGGPTSIINNKLMANSDFFTGAFPAEYGNSISSVFDLRLRNGNNENFEHSLQFGILGAEVLSEGPISKEKRSSYLVGYRYSTLGWFQQIGVDVGTDAIPNYQDLSFKLNFPKGKSNISLWGIGGMSNISIMVSDQREPSIDLYGENDRDQHFGTRTGVLGLTYTRMLNDKSFLSSTFAGSHENQTSHHDYVIRHLDADSLFVLDSLYTYQDYSFSQNKYSNSTAITTKFNSNHTIKYGVNFDFYTYNFLDSALVEELVSDVFQVRWDAQGTAVLAQPFIQWKWKPNNRITVNTGLHSQYFSLSNSLSIVEPRAGVKYKINESQNLSAGLGLHSQIQPLYTYMYHQFDNAGNKVYHNQNMDFTKSIHYVLGYDNAISSTMRIKSEVYYQSLYNIPVEVQSSAFSLVNQGSGFTRFFPDSLENTGTGTNYGVELTVEKFFSNKFYYLLTGSLYESKYIGSDGVQRDTDFNGNFAFNALAGKEFKTGDRSTLTIGTKITWAGGQRYGNVDTLASNTQNELIFLDEGYNENQFEDYFRADLKINYKINGSKKNITHEIGLDLVNLTGQQNILGLTYTPNQPDGIDFRKNYQLGFLPIFFYRIDF